MRAQQKLARSSLWPSPSSAIPVAGDSDDTHGPTYATFRTLLRDNIDHPVDALVTTVDRGGNLAADQRLAAYGVGAHQYVPLTNHWVADPFWAFMTSAGTVLEDGASVTDLLFANPFYGTGYPITEAYWTTVSVRGEPTDVLVQCFERRCLTYTPSNTEGWKVEASNVGRHYYRWRYGHDLPGGATATAFMVAPDDAGRSGIPVGCGDSLVAVTIPIWPTSSLEERIAAALTVLLAYRDPFFGESGLYNALYNNDARVERVSVGDAVATVNLTGSITSAGTCDDPRIVGQLEQTVLAVEGVDEVVFLMNGAPFPPRQS